MEIFWSEKLNLSQRTKNGFRDFVNGMSKRIAQGHARYGHPDRRKKYHSRLREELKAYNRTGNAENLLNIANYAFLEMIEPEHKKFHFNAHADSVTRGRGWE